MRRQGGLSAGVALLAGVAIWLGLVTPASAAAVAVMITDGGACGRTFCYVADPVAASVGDTVTWTNQTAIGASHTVSRCTVAACGVDGGTGTDTGFTSSAALGAGQTYSHQFTAAGTYVYYCQIHGYAAMHGTVQVAAPAATTTTSTTVATTTIAPSTTSTTAAPATTTTAAAALTTTTTSAPLTTTTTIAPPTTSTTVGAPTTTASTLGSGAANGGSGNGPSTGGRLPLTGDRVFAPAVAAAALLAAGGLLLATQRKRTGA